MPKRAAPQKAPMSRDEVRHAVSQKRRKRRKRIRMLAYTLLLLCFAGAAVALSLTVFFRIGTITVTGSSVYAKDDIETAAGVHLEDNLFLTNTDAAAKKITAALPYAGKAVITRKLPGTLIIEITDTAALAALDSENGYILIDENGKVLSANAAELSDDIAYVKGLTPSKAVLCETLAFADPASGDALLALLKAVKNAGLTAVTEIDLKKLSAVTLLYDDRITLKAGTMTDIEQKMKRAAKAIKDQEERNPAIRGTLDLTIEPNAYFRETKKK